MEPGDKWTAGNAHQALMGRWSDLLAQAFVEWLQPARGALWLDVGCGTGALSFAIADAQGLPTRDSGFDGIVSGLALNFIPDSFEAVAVIYGSAVVNSIFWAMVLYGA